MQIQTKFDGLKQEYRRGQQEMGLLQDHQAELRAPMLRISGSIQVLEELGPDNGGPDDGD